MHSLFQSTPQRLLSPRPPTHASSPPLGGGFFPILFPYPPSATTFKSSATALLSSLTAPTVPFSHGSVVPLITPGLLAAAPTEEGSNRVKPFFLVVSLLPHFLSRATFYIFSVRVFLLLGASLPRLQLDAELFPASRLSHLFPFPPPTPPSLSSPAAWKELRQERERIKELITVTLH